MKFLLQMKKISALSRRATQKSHRVFVSTTALTLLLAAFVSCALFQPMLGIALTSLFCFFLAVIGILHPALRRVTFGLTVLAVAMSVTYSLPGTIDNLTRSCIFYATLLLLSVWYQFLVTRENVRASTPVNYFIVLPQALVLGQLLGLLSFTFAPEAPAETNLTPLIGSIFLAAAAEAIYLQGIIHSSLRVTTSDRFAALLTVIIGTVIYSTLLPWFIAALVVATLTIFYSLNRNVPAAIVASLAFKASLLGLLFL